MLVMHACGYLYEPEYNEKDHKCIAEEEVAAAAAAKRHVQPVCENEKFVCVENVIWPQLNPTSRRAAFFLE